MCSSPFRDSKRSIEMIKIKDLHVETDNKEILKGINLDLEKGKVYALIGPNGSGKSTLANVIMGNPKFQVTKGRIVFNDKDITKISVTERAKLGIFMSFQTPNEIHGVPTSAFLRQAHNSTAENKSSLLEFRKLVEKESKSLNMKEEFLSRYVNEGFSGGEKKKSEILQMLVLKPKLAILDEPDSGADADTLKLIANAINQTNKSVGTTVLIITHHNKILKYLKPDKVFVIIGGKIVKEGSKDLADEIDKRGYAVYSEL